MANDQSDLNSRIDALERRLEPRRHEDLVRDIHALEQRVESLSSAVWITGVVLTVVAVVVGVFAPFAVDDEESFSLAGLVFAIGEAVQDGDSMIVWIPLAMLFLVAVAAAVLIVGLRTRRVSARWAATARVVSWIYVLGCLGGFLLLLIANSRSRDAVDVLPAGLVFLSAGAVIAALLTTAGRDWISEPTALVSRRL